MTTPDNYQGQEDTYPVGYPVAWSTPVESRPSDAEAAPSGAGNTPRSAPPLAASPAARPPAIRSTDRRQLDKFAKRSCGTDRQVVGRRQLQRLNRELSERERAVLWQVARHRLLSTRQIERFEFTQHASPTTAARMSRRVVRRLASLRLLDHLERRVGGVRAGSSGFIWQLGPVGERVLAMDLTQAAPRTRHEPSLRLVDHYLAIAEAHLRLLEAARGGVIELVSVELEPASWRSFLGLGGERRLVRPDLSVITALGDYEDHWFLEVDLATEHPATIVRKCRHYEDYRASGQLQRDLGVFPRVVWLVPSKARQERLTGALQQAQLDPGLYRVVLAQDLAAHTAGGAS